jgi:hypothetical protein
MLLNGVFIHEDLLVMAFMFMFMCFFFFWLLSIYFILHKMFIFEHPPNVAFVDSFVRDDERGGATNNVHAIDVVFA